MRNIAQYEITALSLHRYPSMCGRSTVWVRKFCRREFPKTEHGGMILLIDSYDSFSQNLRRLIEENTNKEVVTIFNDTFVPDEYEEAFENWIKYFDYIIVGPGPGHPSNDCDIGIIKWLYQRYELKPLESVPTLGVCLGFQSLCNVFGNEVITLDTVKHGQVYDIIPTSSDLFGTLEEELSPFSSVRYHSLHVELSTLNDLIIPLAICNEPGSSPDTVLMAGKHRELPLYGVQYHPESICSAKGNELMRKFDSIASAYNSHHRANLCEHQKERELNKINDKNAAARAVHEESLVTEFKDNKVSIQVQKFGLDEGIAPIDVCDHLYKSNTDFFFLNSASEPGSWSIIALPIAGESEVITHSVDEPSSVIILKYKCPTDFEKIEVSSVWEYFASRMESTFCSRSTLEKQIGDVHSRPLPFLGGYLGLFSYEEGKYVHLNKLESFCEGNTPDTKLVFIERAILHDRVSNDWFVVSIHCGDKEEWCEQYISSLKNAGDIKIDLASVPASVKLLCDDKDQTINYEFPEQEVYERQFQMCQEFLHSGDSYELCLTTQLKLFLPKYLNTWDIYKVLALHKNPSPYSSYMDFDDCVLISSSPERFMSWTDNKNVPGNKLVELRPIKGTVKNTEEMTLQTATKILRTPKEMGENLMIVDLIRHDLSTFIDDVTVSSLMAVEEYKTVYQLVSVIQGNLTRAKPFTGIDVLHLSLPPGSMTGAPKKRSVEILQDIESMQRTMVGGGRRGIYSGVAGYWSITDDSDWSVVIRSIMHYKKDLENGDRDVWRIGAGGAITVLSDVKDEWEEMQVKLSSTLQTFT